MDPTLLKKLREGTQAAFGETRHGGRKNSEGYGLAAGVTGRTAGKRDAGKRHREVSACGLTEIDVAQRIFGIVHAVMAEGDEVEHAVAAVCHPDVGPVLPLATDLLRLLAAAERSHDEEAHAVVFSIATALIQGDPELQPSRQLLDQVQKRRSAEHRYDENPVEFLTAILPGVNPHALAKLVNVVRSGVVAVLRAAVTDATH
jgi:hypothetical protein